MTEVKRTKKYRQGNTSMTDYTSRQEAIDALDQIFDRCEEIEAHLPEGDPDRIGYKMYPDYITVWKYLHQLPSAQPERKTGKWVHEIDTGADMLKCSACECRVIELEYKTAVGLQGFTYCPYCGAKMEVADGQ